MGQCIDIVMKTPDCVNDAAWKYTNSLLDGKGSLDETKASYRDHVVDDLKNKLSNWFRYGEQVTLRYDMVNNTLIVVEDK